MVKLQDGKIYENMNGDRFRVTWNGSKGCFECRRSSRVGWGRDGLATSGDMWDALVREVPELRWVPMSKVYDLCELDNDVIYTVKRGHLFKQVTRAEAQRMAPNYKPPEQILIKREQLGAKIESVRQGTKDFLRITTPAGKVVIVEV